MDGRAPYTASGKVWIGESWPPVVACALLAAGAPAANAAARETGLSGAHPAAAFSSTIDAAAHADVFEPTNQVGDTTFRCMGATPTGSGTARLGKHIYVAGTPTDTFTVTGLT